jgi:hypothetical protein
MVYQSRVDRISTDLDELRKALNERAKHLGIEVKEQPAIETPFGEVSMIHMKL